MSNKKITITDVANAVGVSKTTISHYLNKKFDAISPQTREKIANTIESLGYICNENYHRQKKTMQLGLIVTDLTDPFITTLCKGVGDAAMHYGYDVLIANTNNNRKVEKKYIKSFANKTDGLILNTCGMDEETFSIIGEKTQIVLADRVIEKDIFDVVSSNNYEAMTQLMNHLYSMDYTAYALFTEELVYGAARHIRHKAFMDFADSHNGAGFFESYTINLFDDKELMLKTMEFVRNASGKKKVIIGINGRTLLRILSALNALGLKIPENIGICGYDDFDWANLINGGITTVKQPTYEIGYECVEKLISRMKNPNEKVKTTLLRSRLMLRNSLK